MEFLALLLFNIFCGAIFYLIITLKLERSATEFREKKLKKEMDALMKEFNSAAERNITLLENRISIFRKLMDKSGAFQSVDFTVEEKEALSVNHEGTKKNNDGSIPADIPVSLPVQHDGIKVHPGNSGRSGTMKKSLINFIVSNTYNIRDRVLDYLHKNTKYDPDEDTGSRRGEDGSKMHFQNIIEKDLSHLAVADEIVDKGTRKNKESKTNSLNDDEIIRLISDADDKYEVITELYKKGYTIEDISRFSNIPMGEIKLVLNLNNSLDSFHN